MSAALRQYGRAWARGAQQWAFGTALGPDFANVALARDAMPLVLASS